MLFAVWLLPLPWTCSAVYTSHCLDLLSWKHFPLVPSLKLLMLTLNCCSCGIFLHKFSWRREFSCYYFFVRDGSISFNKWLYPIFQVGLSSAELKLNIDLCRTLVLSNPCWNCSQEKGVMAKIIPLYHPLPNWIQSGCGEWSQRRLRIPHSVPMSRAGSLHDVRGQPHLSLVVVTAPVCLRREMTRTGGLLVLPRLLQSCLYLCLTTPGAGGNCVCQEPSW